MDDNIQVYARIRPHAGGVKIAVTANPAAKEISLSGGQSFVFDHAAGPATTQEEVFEAIGLPIARACLDGYHGTVFAYGQTGSGKSFTIHGSSDATDADAPARGLLPRSLEFVFARIAEREAASDGALTFTLRATFVEIYNERIYDLLAASGGDGKDKEGASLQLREHVGRGVYIEGVSEQTVSSAAAAHALWARGNRSRSVAATAMNRESSRSHSVFTLVVEATEKRDAITRSRVAQFNMVDLAGSERQKLTGATGDRLKEAGQINKSLSALGNVIHALVDISLGKQRHVHYRDSRLTWLLRDTLGGNSKTALIATLSPTDDCFAETLSTLKFAARAKLVRNRAIVNEDTLGSVAQLQAELKAARQQLAELTAAASGMFTQAGGASVAGTTEGSSSAAAATTAASSSGRMDFGPSIAAWDAVMEDVMQQQQPMPHAPASLPAGAEDLLASARASGAAAAVKDVSAGAAAAVLATVSAKAAAAAGRGVMAGSEAAQCPSRTLRAVAAAADRIDRLEGLLADVLERAVRSEGDADEAAERSAAAMQQVAALETTVAAQAAVLRQREERISSLLAAAAAPAPCATVTSDDAADLASVAAQAAPAPAAPAPPLQQQQQQLQPVSRLVQPKATGLRRPSATTVPTAALVSSSLGSTSASAAPTSTKVPAKSVAPSTGAAAASAGASTRIPLLTAQPPPGGAAPSKNPVTGRRPSLSTMASGTAQLAGRRVSSSSAAAAGAAAAAVAAEQVAAEAPALLLSAATGSLGSGSGDSRSVAELAAEVEGLSALLSASQQAAAMAARASSDEIARLQAALQAATAAAPGSGDGGSRRLIAALSDEISSITSELTQLRAALQRADPATLPLVRAERAAASEAAAAAEAALAERAAAAAVKEAAAEARRKQDAEDAAAERDALRDNIEALEAVNTGVLAELGDARRAGTEATRRAEALARDREGLRAQLTALETSLKAGESEAAGVIGGHAARIAALQGDLAVAAAEASSAAAEAETLRTELGVSKAEAETMRKEASSLRSMVDKLRHETGLATSASTEARAAAVEAKEAAAAAAQRTAAYAAAAEAAEARLAEAIKAAAEAATASEIAVKDASSRAQRAEFGLESLEEDLHTLEAEGTFLRAQRDELRVALATATSAGGNNEQVERELAVARAMLEQIERELAGARAALETSAVTHTAAMDAEEKRHAEDLRALHDAAVAERDQQRVELQMQRAEAVEKALAEAHDTHNAEVDAKLAEQMAVAQAQQAVAVETALAEVHSAVDIKLAAAQRETSDARAQLALLQQTLAEARESLEETTAECTSMRARLAEYEVKLSEALNAAADFGRQTSEARASAEHLNQRLAIATAARDESVAAVAVASARADDAEKALMAMQASASLLETALAEATGRVAELSIAARDAEAAAVASSARAASQEALLERLEQMTLAKTAEIAALQARLGAAGDVGQEASLSAATPLGVLSGNAPSSAGAQLTKAHPAPAWVRTIQESYAAGGMAVPGFFC